MIWSGLRYILKKCSIKKENLGIIFLSAELKQKSRDWIKANITSFAHFALFCN